MRPWRRFSDGSWHMPHAVGDFFIEEDSRLWWRVSLVIFERPGVQQMGIFPSVSQAQHAVGLMLDLIEKAADANRN